MLFTPSLHLQEIMLLLNYGNMKKNHILCYIKHVAFTNMITYDLLLGVF